MRCVAAGVTDWHYRAQVFNIPLATWFHHADRAPDSIRLREARAVWGAVAELRGSVFAAADLWGPAGFGGCDSRWRNGSGDRAQRRPRVVVSWRADLAVGVCGAGHGARG